MNHKTKKLLGYGAVGALLWYFYNQHQKAQAATAAAAAIAAAQVAKSS